MLYNIRLLLWINFISMLVACSQGTFTLREHENNEVIFVEERITLECRAPGHVSNPQFKLLDSQNNVLVDQDFMFYADDHIGYPDPDGGANYAITLKSVIQNRYLCEISGDNGVLSTEEVNLNVFPRDSPQCFMNTSASVTIGEVIGLSCYHEVGIVLNADFRWRQILRDGTVYEQFPPEYSELINQFKRKLSTSRIASLNDGGSEFECVIIDSGSEKTCSTGEISIQQNQELELTISPDRVYSLDRGQSQTFSCESSDPRYNVLWVRNTGYQNTDANVDFSGSVISVSIPTDTTIMNGVVLTFECAATFGESTKSEILLVFINFESNLNPLPTTTTTTTTTTQPTQVMLTFTPATVPPLDRGDIVEVKCSPSLENYEVMWIRPVNVSERDAEINNRGSTLHIHIPIDTTLISGTFLTFFCLASFNGVVFNKELTLNVVFKSTTNPAPTSTTPLSRPTIPLINTSNSLMTSPSDDNMMKTDPDDEQDTNGGNDLDGGTNTEQDKGGTDFTIFIVIAGVVAVILVAIIVIILIAICMTKQVDHLSKEERTFGNAAYDYNDPGGTSVRYTPEPKSSMNHPGPDVVPYSDVSRGRHVIEIDEDEIYDDSKDWRGGIEI
ncbi:hypothetical protein HOLleu_41096 [Holothuria leucospilota]|uniref:Ig-like domain-containing protein n=1 Tax=Holothuria leucospilota TaxID=206669 RepID=A0A9Q0YD72_HOLLE|nr:hypothetical protein HOLleu_41096 [Holothuria leucospilota]